MLSLHCRMVCAPVNRTIAGIVETFANSFWLAAIFLVAFSFVAVLPMSSSAQSFEELYLVTSPTAGILPHGGYLFYGGIGPESSLLFGVKIGFHDRLMLGATFGIQEFIGRGKITVNNRPGFQVRLRMLEESEKNPAMAIGIDTQGETRYLDDEERYERKSKGFFAVISKNYRSIRDISFHCGINYSLETRDEKGLNAFCGTAVEVFPGMSILVDYNAAFDDNDSAVLTHRTRGRGYLDTGIRFDYMDNLRIKILFKDLLNNYIPEGGVARTVEIFYVNYF